jgi:hypothetical protein
LTKDFAAELGDPAPSSAEYVLTTRSAANQLFGAGVNTDEPAYLVVMGGRFTMQNAGVFGQPDPSGAFAFWVIDVAPERVLDRGITSIPGSASLGSLGTVGPGVPP